MDAQEFFKACIEEALQLNGQDIFLKAGSVPRARMGGEVKVLPFDVVEDADIQAIVLSLLSSSKQWELEQNRSADFAFNLPGDARRFRGNVFYQQGHLSLVIRLLWKKVPSFEELRIPAIMGQVALGRSGIVLIGGTVASGKTTTLTAMIDRINRHAEKHIVTVEDPVEYIHTDLKSLINQREIGEDAHDYISALRYAVRQSPDIIVIGEMRDAESFNSALASAEVGRLVLATVHAQSVTQIFDRVLGFFPPNQRDIVLGHLSFNIACFCCQKLLVTKQGRYVPAFEIMLGDPMIRQLVRDKKFDKLQQAMRNNTVHGMQTFDQALLQLYNEDLISEKTALQMSQRPQDMENLMRGIVMDGSRGRILGE